MKVGRPAVVFSGTAALGLLLGGTTAVAQESFSGAYIAGGAGANFLDAITLEDVTIAGGPTRRSRNLDFDTGFVGSLAVGTIVFPNVRAEAELSYRGNDLEAVTVQNEGPQSITGGEATAFAAMLNGWIDIPVNAGEIVPYIGGGVGGAEISIDATTLGAGPCAISSCEALDFDDSEFVFAFQLGAGVAYGAPGGPQFTLDYRYFNAGSIDVSFSGDRTGSANSTDYEAHSIMIGFRVPVGGMSD